MPLVPVTQKTIVTANKVAPIYRFPPNYTNASSIASISTSETTKLTHTYTTKTINITNTDRDNTIGGNVNILTLNYGSVSIITGYTAPSFSIKNFCDNYSPLSLLKISGHTTGAAVGDWYSATNWSAAATGTKAGVTALNMSGTGQGVTGGSINPYNASVSSFAGLNFNVTGGYIFSSITNLCSILWNLPPDDGITYYFEWTQPITGYVAAYFGVQDPPTRQGSYHSGVGGNGNGGEAVYTPSVVNAAFGVSSPAGTYWLKLNVSARTYTYGSGNTGSGTTVSWASLANPQYFGIYDGTSIYGSMNNFAINWGQFAWTYPNQAAGTKPWTEPSPPPGASQISTTRIITLPQNYTLFYAWFPTEIDTYDRTLHRGTYEILAKMQAGSIPRLGAYSNAFSPAASDYTGYRVQKKWQTLIVVGHGPTATSRLGVQQYYVDGKYVGRVAVTGSGANINTLGSGSTGFLNPPGFIREAGILGQALDHNEIISLHLRLTFTFDSNMTAVSSTFFNTPESVLVYGKNSTFANKYVSSSQLSETNLSAVKPTNSLVNYSQARITGRQNRFVTVYPITQITIIINGFSPEIIPTNTGVVTGSPRNKQHWF